MSAREQAAAIADAVRSSLQIAAEHGMSIKMFLDCDGDKVIGNNAAQVIALAEEVSPC